MNITLAIEASYGGYVDVAVPSRSLYSVVRLGPSRFSVRLLPIEAVLFRKCYNDLLEVSGETSTVSVLKMLELLLGGLCNFSTAMYSYTFSVDDASTDDIRKYLASLEFLDYDEEDDSSDAIGNEDVASDASSFLTGSEADNEPIYIQLSDDERQNVLSPYIRLTLDDDDNDDDASRDRMPMSEPPSAESAYSEPVGLQYHQQHRQQCRRRRRHRFFRKQRQMFYQPAAKSIKGYMLLNIVSATGLPPFKDSIRLRYDMDPFVVVSFGTKVYKTKARRHNLNPVWIGQFINLEVTDLEENFDIRFNILDKDYISYNDKVCSAEVPLRQLIESSEDATNNNNNNNNNNNECGWMPFELKMDMASGASQKYQHYNPLLQFKYKFQPIEELESRLKGIDLDTVPVAFNSCPLCGERDKRNVSLLKHVAVCQSGLRPKTFIRKSYTSPQSASRRWYTKALIKIAYGKLRLGVNNANIMVQDRISGMIIEEQMSIQIRLGIRLLYRSIRTNNSSKRIKKVLRKQSLKQGLRFEMPESVRKIDQFVRFYALDLSECLKSSCSDYKTFNEFFSRQLKPGSRTIEGDDEIVTSAADSRLTVFSSVESSVKLWIKGRDFSVHKLIGGTDGFEESCSVAIFRLAPQDYHRFHSPVGGKIVRIKHIDGEYYTVNPMAIRSKLDVFGENVRTIIEIDSPTFGKVVLCAVGAMMVGSILTTVEVGNTVSKGQELGYFKFGGSTVIALFQLGKVVFDSDLLYNSEVRTIETLVKVGMSIGHAPGHEQFKRHVSNKPVDRLKIIRTVTGGQTGEDGMYSTDVLMGIGIDDDDEEENEEDTDEDGYMEEEEDEERVEEAPF